MKETREIVVKINTENKMRCHRDCPYKYGLWCQAYRKELLLPASSFCRTRLEECMRDEKLYNREDIRRHIENELRDLSDEYDMNMQEKEIEHRANIITEGLCPEVR